MANDIRNILTISGNQKLIDEMLKAIQVDAFGRGSIDFKKGFTDTERFGYTRRFRYS